MRAVRKSKIMRNSLAKLLAVVLTAGSLLVGAAPGARANAVPWGDPVLGHSWVQLWVVTLDDVFDTVFASISAPATASFEAPGFLNFSADSWSIQSGTARELRALGAATHRLEFTTHLVGFPEDYSAANPLVMDLSFVLGESYSGGNRWIFDGNGWVTPPVGVAEAGSLNVPDGGVTLLLLGVSLLGMTALYPKKAGSRP